MSGAPYASIELGPEPVGRVTIVETRSFWGTELLGTSRRRMRSDALRIGELGVPTSLPSDLVVARLGGGGTVELVLPCGTPVASGGRMSLRTDRARAVLRLSLVVDDVPALPPARWSRRPVFAIAGVGMLHAIALAFVAQTGEPAPTPPATERAPRGYLASADVVDDEGGIDAMHAPSRWRISEVP